ncbi:hypothetical protein VST7929_02127 [Vibrio stylophorae]|uniref:diguanylate cyclase n=1 Tax=Vibrio stylophorae TaxID=659351 RepID=A0ABM8ZV58_9VIBR|nr:GGDEF domain-containing protein [Vibrio stylophorae]CAH0534214.1 hypothetical protein VST7929_02127 [Vibrio stylophorae]
MDSTLWEHLFEDKPRRQPIGVEQRLLLLQKLQGKLELKPLFHAFLSELSKQLDVASLVWDFEGTSYIIKAGKGTEFRQRFSLQYAKQDLGILQYSTPYSLDEDEIRLINTYHKLFAGSLSCAIEYRRVKNMALRDCLTGLGNRTSFEQDLNHAIALCQREQSGLVLIMFDLNNFKQVNDTYGHLDGDRVLSQFAHVLQSSLRACDRCYRLGGDEFSAILQPATEESIYKVTQRIEQHIQTNSLLARFRVRTAMGSAMFGTGDSYASLYDRADRQLYKHKRN